ncbi:hypothetical protein H4S08_003790 [Coemansia sp. RSA 1365]|nr:hypothetical protein H4S08_003790 [Coemansia sp. RSA 1365]
MTINEHSCHQIHYVSTAGCLLNWFVFDAAGCDHAAAASTLSQPIVDAITRVLNQVNAFVGILTQMRDTEHENAQLELRCITIINKVAAVIVTDAAATVAPQSVVINLRDTSTY